MADAADWEQIASGMDDMREMLSAMRAQLIADGWTREQAQDLIASCFRGLHQPEQPEPKEPEES